MTTFATAEATVAGGRGPVADAAYRVREHPAADVAAEDSSAEARTLQRFAQLASGSPRVLHLQQRSAMIAASPATVTLQRFQQMTNRSPRALQLKRQSETMSPRASGENRPPQFRSDERHWLRSDPGHRADGSPGAVLQAVCKTPTLAEATPANMMTGPAEQGGKEPGLPDSTYVLINVDSPDNIVTLAHELAHVVGYNPTGVESSGHFTDSTSYQQAEAEYGPKLLFDAYYFEVLFRRLAGG